MISETASGLPRRNCFSVNISSHSVGSTVGLKHIRPYKVFTLVDTPPSERIAHFQIPPRRGAGGISMLETALLIAIAQAVAAKRVFEFGTFLGSTTLNLALNIAADGRIFTLDLDDRSARSLNQHPADAPLTKTHLVSRPDFEGSQVASKITQLRGNSLEFDFSRWAGSIDLVFVDGGHDLETVTADTEAAFRLVARDRPSCVLWHDYGNADYPELTAYLEQVAATRQLFHVEDTMLCAWFDDGIAARIT